MNIFGGIIQCDEIAKGIIAAAQEIEIKAPLVVRLQGTPLHFHLSCTTHLAVHCSNAYLLCAIPLGNRQKVAKELIKASGLRMIAIEDFDKAAETVSQP